MPRKHTQKSDLHGPSQRQLRVAEEVRHALSAVFAATLLGTAALASRSLRQRDAAVRDGILSRAAHDLEARLRGVVPEEAPPVLEAFLLERASTVSQISTWTECVWPRD